MSSKEMNQIIKDVEANGFTVVRGGKHYKIKNANGGTVFSMPTTPGGGRWKQNLLADLRRKGILPR